MKPQFHFEEKKFKSLEEKQQHKKCAELLGHLYKEYAKMAGWCGETAPELLSLETLADLYHDHAKKANLSFKEHNLLPRIQIEDVQTGDRSFGEAYLPITIYLDRIRSSHNIGSIMRTTEALRLGALLFSKGMALPTSKQVQDTSMGACNWVKWQEAENIDTIPHPIICLETVPNAESYLDFAFPDSFTLVLGNEEQGCSSKLLEKAAACVQIPLFGKKNSLNVACSFAIVASHIAQQKRNKKL